MVNGANRVDIKSGINVLIILKQGRRSGKRTKAFVKDLLPKSPTHPHRVKVRGERGEIGRLKKFLLPKQNRSETEIHQTLYPTSVL
jgi:uncharacterized repeat protein (TIGR03833 family)